jgi:formylglycine-generating enzyme required for sulfatase activity
MPLIRTAALGIVSLVVSGAAALATQTRSPGQANKPPLEVVTNSVGMKLALIPAGEFLMGAPESDEDAEGHERPRHKVRISKPFYLQGERTTFHKSLTENHLRDLHKRSWMYAILCVTRTCGF